VLSVLSKQRLCFLFTKAKQSLWAQCGFTSKRFLSFRKSELEISQEAKRQKNKEKKQKKNSRYRANVKARQVLALAIPGLFPEVKSVVESKREVGFLPKPVSIYSLLDIKPISFVLTSKSAPEEKKANKAKSKKGKVLL